MRGSGHLRSKAPDSHRPLPSCVPRRDRRRCVAIVLENPTSQVPLVAHTRTSARLSRPDSAPLGFQRHQRLDVVAHDPRQWQMRRGGNQVGDEERLLAVRLEQQSLMVRACVPASECLECRRTISRSPSMKSNDPRFDERNEIVREVAGRRFARWCGSRTRTRRVASHIARSEMPAERNRRPRAGCSRRRDRSANGC